MWVLKRFENVFNSNVLGTFNFTKTSSFRERRVGYRCLFSVTLSSQQYVHFRTAGSYDEEIWKWRFALFSLLTLFSLISFYSIKYFLIVCPLCQWHKTFYDYSSNDLTDIESKSVLYSFILRLKEYLQSQQHKFTTISYDLKSYNATIAECYITSTPVRHNYDWFIFVQFASLLSLAVHFNKSFNFSIMSLKQKHNMLQHIS